MGEFNLFDVISIFIILLSAYFAYLRGAVREIMSVASWIVAAILAYIFAPSVNPVVTQLPVFGKYLTGSCELSVIMSFTLVFAIAIIVCSFATSLLVRLTKIPGVGMINKGMGLIFGVLRGIIIVAVVLILHDAVFSETQLLPTVTGSWSATVFHDLQMQIKDMLPSNATSKLSVIYNNVTAICVDTGTPTPENLPPATPGETQPAGG